MARVLTVLTTTLVLLWPILESSASSDFFYNSVTPAAGERASEKPAAVLPDCAIPPGLFFDPQFVREALTVAYEVNGNSFCGGNGITDVVWLWNIPSGTKVKVRYAIRNTTSSLFACLPTDSLYLYLDAPAMGINKSLLNSQGQWIPAGVLTFFRPVPPTSEWTDLYNDTPPKGDYVLEIGCDTGFRWGQIRFSIQ